MMKALRKKLMTVAVITGLGLTTIAVAGPWGGGGCDMMGEGGRGHGRMGGNPEQRMERMQQFHAERMELLAARLKLKPEQESAWKSFTAAQESHYADKMKMRQAMRDQKETTVQAHFEERIQKTEQRLAGLKSMAKATGDLYAVLDPAQKKVMDDFFTRRPMRGMRGQGGPSAPPAAPVAPATSQ